MNGEAGMTRQSILSIGYAALVLAFAIGCQYQPLATHAVTTQNRAEILTEFHELLAKKVKVVFRSWNGKWIGTDCDTDVIFRPAEVVEVVEYRDAIARYEGKYSLDDDGVASLWFEGLSEPWLALVLERDSKSFLLRLNDSKQGLVNGYRRWDGYWPFRAI